MKMKASSKSDLVVALISVSTLISGIHAQSSSSVPDYVLDYAPLVYLDVNEQYYPSDIGAQLTNTYPAINFTLISNPSSDLTLSTLSQLNGAGDCTLTNIGSCYVYLTSNDNVTINPPSPQWLYGVLPNVQTGATDGAMSAAVIVNDRGNGMLDAFYFYFYAFNHGQLVGDVTVDDHVGDWEHNMIRFQDGKPVSIWYSQHSSGEAYTYAAVSKLGNRPVCYSSLGGHANYATPGSHELYFGAAFDDTSAGPLWDPIRGAYFYAFTPSSAAPTDDNGTFTALAPSACAQSPTAPVDWLYYLGRWGDKMYPSSRPGQDSLGGIASTFEDGPTGPLDKDLNREDVCPDGDVCSTRSSLEAATSTMASQTISRSYPAGQTPTAGVQTALATQTSYAVCAASASASASSSGSPSGTASADGQQSSGTGSAMPEQSTGAAFRCDSSRHLEVAVGFGLLSLLSLY